jgi:hypothetical protein
MVDFLPLPAVNRTRVRDFHSLQIGKFCWLFAARPRSSPGALS